MIMGTTLRHRVSRGWECTGVEQSSALASPRNGGVGRIIERLTKDELSIFIAH